MKTAMSSNVGMGRHDDHATAHLAERTLVHTAAAVVGMFLVFLAFGGFVYPDYMNMHLTTTRSLMNLVVGAVSVYFGLFATTSGASLLCVAIGAIYAVLTVAGFAFGATADPMVAGPDNRLLKVIPGVLEFGVWDHVFHAMVGAVLLVSGFLGFLGTDAEHR